MAPILMALIVLYSQDFQLFARHSRNLRPSNFMCLELQVHLHANAFEHRKRIPAHAADNHLLL